MVMFKDIQICTIHKKLEHCWASKFVCDKHGNMGIDDQHSRMIKTDKTCSVCKTSLSRVNPSCKYEKKRVMLD